MHICEALLVNYTLKNLSLEYNYISDNFFVQYFITLLTKSKTLKHVREHNLFFGYQIYDLVNAFKTNGILIDLPMRHDCMPYLMRNRDARKRMKLARGTMRDLHPFPHDLAQLIDVEIWSSRADSAWWDT